MSEGTEWPRVSGPRPGVGHSSFAAGFTFPSWGATARCSHGHNVLDLIFGNKPLDNFSITLHTFSIM